MCILSPEHYDTLVKGGIKSKKEFSEKLWHYTNQGIAASLPKIVQTVKPGVLGFIAGYALGAYARVVNMTGFSSSLVPKFLEPASFHVVVAGGPAGKFSTFLPCFGALKPPHPFANLSRAVHRKVVPQDAKAMAAGIAAAAVVAAPATARDGKLILLDPTHEIKVSPFKLAKRTGKLVGTVGFLDISKPGGSKVFDRLAELIQASFPGVAIERFVKETFGKVATDGLRNEIVKKCNFMVLALAD